VNGSELELSLNLSSFHHNLATVGNWVSTLVVRISTDGHGANSYEKKPLAARDDDRRYVHSWL